MPLTAKQIEEIAMQAAKQAVTDIVEEAAERAAHKAAEASKEQTSQLIAESVRQTLVQLGVESESPLEMQRDFQHLRQWRLAGEELRSKSIIAAMGIFLSGLFALLAIGAKGWFNS